MIVSTTGRHKYVSLKQCKAAVQFAADHLISKKLANNIRLRLWFTIEETRAKDWLGYCDWTDSHVRPREFEIALDPLLSKKDLFHTIFHEMTHLKQYATGQLKEYVKMAGTVTFDGRQYKDNREQSITSPWEKEARFMEKVLYKEYLDSI